MEMTQIRDYRRKNEPNRTRKTHRRHGKLKAKRYIVLPYSFISFFFSSSPTLLCLFFDLAMVFVMPKPGNQRNEKRIELNEMEIERQRRKEKKKSETEQTSHSHFHFRYNRREIRSLFIFRSYSRIVI